MTHNFERDRFIRPLKIYLMRQLLIRQNEALIGSFCEKINYLSKKLSMFLFFRYCNLILQLFILVTPDTASWNVYHVEIYDLFDWFDYSTHIDTTHRRQKSDGIFKKKFCTRQYGPFAIMSLKIRTMFTMVVLRPMATRWYINTNKHTNTHRHALHLSNTQILYLYFTDISKSYNSQTLWSWNWIFEL